MSFVSPFNPMWGKNQVLTAAAGSGTTPVEKSARQLRILNTGANVAYIRTYATGDSVTTASVADMPIAPSSGTTITKPQHHDNLAYISATGTTLQVMPGTGN